MRIFTEPNLEGGFTCPICNKGDIEPVTLVGIFDTLTDNGTMEAIQVHVKCLSLVFFKIKGTDKCLILHPEELDY